MSKIVQVRSYPNNTLHIQGSGESVNRDYGVAVTLDCNQYVVEWLDEQLAILPSLAGTEALYSVARAELEFDNKNVLVLEIPGTESESLANGAELRIVRNEQSEPLFKFVEQEDDFEDEDEVQKYTVDFNF
jgi:hypothetical protein